MFLNGNDLFNSKTWFDFTQGRVDEATEEIKKLEPDYFEANTIEAIQRYFFEKYSINVPTLKIGQKDPKIIEQDVRHYEYFAEAMGDDPYVMIPGYKVILDIPFDGDSRLFYVQPNPFILGKRYSGEILGNELTISLEFAQREVDKDGIKISSSLNEVIEDIDKALSQLRSSATVFNKNLESDISRLVQGRLVAVNKLKSIKIALKIPMKESDNPSALRQVPIKINTIAPLTRKSGEAKAYISDDDYESILKAIRNIGSSLETNEAAKGKDEEATRDIFLSGLSASIENGVVGGELFRKNGKTDIAIPFEGKSAFIAECKNWRGKKYLNDGISQLLSYATWRDAKLAIIIFNRKNNNFSAILSQIPAIFMERSDFVRENYSKENEWRFTLMHPTDQQRHVAVHVFVFDLVEQ